MRLQGKVAIITGAAQGLGQGIARRFAQEGAVCVLTDVLAKKLDQPCAEILAMGGEAMAVVADISVPEQVKALVAETIQRYSTVDILCNNADISFEKPVENISFTDWNRLLAVNLGGVFLTTREVFPVMKRQGRGAIVNIASELALVGYEELSAYTASKGGVIAFSRSVALEGARHGIRVNCICPGAADTPMFWNGETDPAKIELLLQNVRAEKPGGRLVTPEEVAAGAIFLASDEASAVTGTYLVMDVGYTAK